MEKISIKTQTRSEFVDITNKVQTLISQNNINNGALLLYCPHTTCALTVNEGADPDVAKDMTRFFNTLVPQHGPYNHAEGNSDAHIKTSMLGPSLMLIIEHGRVQLGTWQHIYLCEGDGPRNRQVWAQFLKA